MAKYIVEIADEITKDSQLVPFDMCKPSWWEEAYNKGKADAEAMIIRCKDCKHMIINEKHENKPMICCLTKMCGTTAPDWFCAGGERRADEVD